GSIDFGLGSGPGMALAAKGGLAIGVAAFAGPPRNMSLVTLPNSPLTTVADLKGKLVAVSTAGSLSEWLVRQIGIQEGWGQEGVRTVALGPTEAAEAALKAHQVDAVMGGAETGIRLEDLRAGRMLATMERYAPLFITHVVFARRAIVEENPRLVSRFLKGFFAAIAFMKTHRAETARIAEKVLQVNANVANKEYDVEGSIFIPDGAFDPQAVMVLKQSFVEMSGSSAPSEDEMFTTRFVPVEP
ncbi:MAG: ABC transporter substrate-binding protein, partial [Limisphaerales bacterium]